MKSLRQAKGFLGLCMILLLLVPSFAGGQETYEPDQDDWTGWDEFLCALCSFSTVAAPPVWALAKPACHD